MRSEYASDFFTCCSLLPFLSPFILIFRESWKTENGAANLVSYSDKCHWFLSSLRKLEESRKGSWRKLPKLYLISWCGNFVERHSFRGVSGNWPETMRKRCLSTKFSHFEIKRNFGILHSKYYDLLHRNYNVLDLGIEKEHANYFHVSFQCCIKSIDHFLEAVIRLFQVLWSSLKAWTHALNLM